MISKAYSEFFKELEKNNHKDWFHANKKHYENDVRAPFLELLSELIPTLRKWDDRIIPDEKKALFRINRDVRFSKDKTPYNTLLKAGFSPNGKKSMLPGYYLGISATKIHVGGGLFTIKPPELKSIRKHIATHIDDFLNCVSSKDFKNYYPELEGEKAKRIDKELIAIAQKTDLIYNKQFYAMAELPLSNHYNSFGLAETILEHFKAIKPLNEFLNKTF